MIYSDGQRSVRGSRIARISLFVALCVSLVAAAFAEDAKVSAEKRALLEDTVSKFMASTNAPGIAVAVVLNGEEVWSEGFGMADLENNAPVTTQTLFRLASISKPITATAAMQLWEQGKLDLEVPIQKYCPAFPQKESPINTRQLMSHLAGVRHYRTDPKEDLETNNTKHFDDPIAGGIQFFANDPLLSKPGSKFNYSTQGFTLVGCAIEGASGEKYVDYVRQHIFVPAGMNSTRWDDRFSVIPHRTRFYSKTKTGVVQNSEFLDSSYKVPGGGWLSSADDMARFEVAVLADRLVERATRDLMWTAQQASSPEVVEEKHRGYALGWGVGDAAGVPDVGHGGGQQGTSTFIMMAPEQKAGVVVLINMDGLDSSALATDLLKIVIGTNHK
jgi:serine beta-lactamase-like protein LACTB, mitochondrial